MTWCGRLVVEKQLGRISSRLGTGRASYSQPSTLKRTVRPLVVEPPPWCLMATTRVISALPPSPGFERGISAETVSRCNHAMRAGVAAKRLRGRIQKGSPKVLAPAVRDSPCQRQATAVVRAIPSLFPGEGGRDGGDRSRIHACIRVAEYGNVNVDGEPGQAQEESRLPKAASARSRAES